MNHLGVTVSDLAAATGLFYAPVLGFLGYQEVERLPEMSLWLAGDGSAINLWQAKPEHRGRAAERYAPGFHHFAFNADSRQRVDDCHELLQTKNITVLDAPAAYDYLPGYYAVFFSDPDGLKYELVHIPPEALAAAKAES
ncbi:VOC family protein [Pelagibius marinus]|uniref:VOC family protein n=1 Tax=Pelagibius marinus TaxID=2762760 RepID=UPI001D049E50|nr:VOC family protein [Pelagibius marinus]